MSFWTSANDSLHYFASDTHIFSSVRPLELIFSSVSVSASVIIRGMGSVIIRGTGSVIIRGTGHVLGVVWDGSVCRKFTGCPSFTQTQHRNAHMAACHLLLSIRLVKGVAPRQNCIGTLGLRTKNHRTFERSNANHMATCWG